jgi:hypothetical protein
VDLSTRPETTVASSRLPMSGYGHVVRAGGGAEYERCFDAIDITSINNGSHGGMGLSVGTDHGAGTGRVGLGNNRFRLSASVSASLHDCLFLSPDPSLSFSLSFCSLCRRGSKGSRSIYNICRFVFDHSRNISTAGYLSSRYNQKTRVLRLSSSSSGWLHVMPLG